jgi:hypothetical protein
MRLSEAVRAAVARVEREVRERLEGRQLPAVKAIAREHKSRERTLEAMKPR